MPGEGSLWQRLGLRDDGFRWLVAVPAALGAVTWGSTFETAAVLALGPAEGTTAAFQAAAQSASPTELAVLFLFGAVGAGVVEELLFRGLVQSRFTAVFGVRMAVVFTALLFGAWHLDFRQGLTAAVIGLWLGFVAARTGSVMTAIVAHLFNNAMASRWLDHEPPRISAIGWALVPAVVCALAVLKLTGDSRRAALDPSGHSP